MVETKYEMSRVMPATIMCVPDEENHPGQIAIVETALKMTYAILANDSEPLVFYANELKMQFGIDFKLLEQLVAEVRTKRLLESVTKDGKDDKINENH